MWDPNQLQKRQQQQPRQQRQQQGWRQVLQPLLHAAELGRPGEIGRTAKDEEGWPTGRPCSSAAACQPPLTHWQASAAVHASCRHHTSAGFTDSQSRGLTCSGWAVLRRSKM